jgi:prolipoprotein diacylglyceryltransferase
VGGATGSPGSDASSTAVVRAGRGWFGCNLPDHRGVWRRRIPTQILEMSWAAAIFGAAILMWDRKLPAGAIFCLAVIANSTGRFLLGPLRDHDQPRCRHAQDDFPFVGGSFMQDGRV